MQKFRGKPACPGIAAGTVTVLKKSAPAVRRIETENTGAELARLEQAKKQAAEQLRVLYEQAKQKIGEEGAAVFEVHQMLLAGGSYLDEVRSRIANEGVNAEYAAAAVGEELSKKFEKMEDAYLKARAADIRDLSDRMLRCLNGEPETEILQGEPFILVADDLDPSEMVRMDPDKILALVTVHGSPDSHTAILARMKNIPALTGVSLNLDELHSGMQAVVDADQGEVIFAPLAGIRAAAERRIAKERQNRARLLELKGTESVTRDGRKICICANIGNAGDVREALENDAEGIGLFRSEFLYLERTDFPTEEEQFRIYRQVLQKMAGKKVVIRTLDIGADKQAEYFHLEKEKNPALGCRAIRLCLKRPEIFKTQLRALFRAAVCGNLAVMYPMIISPEEVLRIRKIAEEAAKELENAKVPYRIPEQGIMIETPAAVMLAGELAGLTDFFSVGTNDLTQYALAIDRENESLQEFRDPRHRAVLKMIRMVTEHAHRCGKWVGVCGELAADPEFTGEFLRIGVDELSVAPPMILKVRKRVNQLFYKI